MPTEISVGIFMIGRRVVCSVLTDFLGDCTFEEAHNGTDYGENAAEDRANAELFGIKRRNDVFCLRAAEADCRKAGGAEQEDGTDNKASRRYNFCDEAVFEYQREQSAD